MPPWPLTLNVFIHEESESIGSRFHVRVPSLLRLNLTSWIWNEKGRSTLELGLSLGPSLVFPTEDRTTPTWGGQDQSYHECTKSEGPTWGLILFVWSLTASWSWIFVKLIVLKMGKARWEIHFKPTCPFTHTTPICQKGDLLHSLISNARHYSVSLEYKQKRSTKRGCSSSFARIYLPVVIL